VRVRALLLSTAVLVLALGGSARATIVASAFDTGLGGWTLSGGSAPAAPTWVTHGGNPGGFAQALDPGTGPELYWDAPAPYVAAGLGAFGGTLAFDRESAPAADQPAGGDVVLTARDGATMRWNDVSLDVEPQLAWTRTAAQFLPSTAWTDPTGAPATVAGFRHVLRHLQSIQVAARYASGPGTDGLDNVLFAFQGLLPPAAAVIALPPAVLSCRGRRPLTILVRPIADVAYRTATVFVNGRAFRDVGGARLAAPVHLAGLPRGRFVLRVVLSTQDGRTLARHRTYRSCLKQGD
jgi:hypothetical protein